MTFRNSKTYNRNRVHFHAKLRVKMKGTLMGDATQPFSFCLLSQLKQLVYASLSLDSTFQNLFIFIVAGVKSCMVAIIHPLILYHSADYTFWVLLLL